MGLERPIILKGKGEEKKEEPVITDTSGDFMAEKPRIFPDAVPESEVEKNPSGPLKTKEEVAMERTKSESVDYTELLGHNPAFPDTEDLLPPDDRLRDAKEIAMERAGRLRQREKEAEPEPKAKTDQEQKGREQELLDHEPELPGQDHPEEWEKVMRGMATDQEEAVARMAKPEQRKEAPLTEEEEVLRGMATEQEEAMARMAKTERPPVPPPTPEKPTVPTPEEQDRMKAQLDELREALVRHEQKGAGDEYGDYGDELARLTREYDAARTEYIDGDRARYVEEQFKLMQKRAEGVPGRFERATENADKFLRKTGGYYIGSALLGLGAIFPPALLARPFFAAPAAFISSYQRLRQYSLHGGLFGAIKGIKNESLRNLDQLSKADIEQRMAMLAAYAKVQGYWGDVRETYLKLNETYLTKVAGAEENFDVNRYASEQVGESRRKFEERVGTEKGRRLGRRLGALGAGAIAGGLVGWLFGTPETPSGSKGTASRLDDFDRQPYKPSPGVPKPPITGPEEMPAPEMPQPEMPQPEMPGLDSGLVEEPPEEFEPIPGDSVAEAPTPADGTETSPAPAETPEPPTGTEAPESPEVTPPAEAFERVIEYIPAEHGLRPEYYDLIKDKTAENFLGRKMFSLSSETQYPYPKTDGEYPWIQQKRISHIRMMDYKHLQEKMGAALDALKGDPAKFEVAKKLPVSEFLKQIMGQQVERATRVIQ